MEETSTRFAEFDNNILTLRLELIPLYFYLKKCRVSKQPGKTYKNKTSGNSGGFLYIFIIFQKLPRLIFLNQINSIGNNIT
ncbi:hypothetical protein CHFL109739_16935 [Chryseobacterium flavum]